MTGPVIDLGVLRHGAEPDPDPSPRLSRPPRANGRRLRCALVLLLVLVTLGAAAAPPPRRAVVTLPVPPGADVLVDGDLLLSIESTGASTLRRRLAAYRLPEGVPLWQAPLSAEARYWGLTLLDGMVLVTGYEIGPGGRGTLTIALDRATGAYRWQQPGSGTELADGNLLLQSGGEGEPVGLRVVDPCCGTVRWQVPPTADVEIQHAGQRANRVVLYRRNGPTEVRDAATGAVLARADLRPPGQGPLDFAQVLGDLLVTMGGEPSTVTAYGLDRLDRRWSVTVGPVEFATDCGVVLCLRTGANELWAIDPTTGVTRWRSDRWRWGWSYDGRLMVSADGGGPLERYLVLDALTGRQLADLGQWQLYQLGVGGKLLGTRRHPDAGVLVGELDIRAGTVRVRDVVPAATGECQAITGNLLCATPDGSYQLWALPD
ncbi:outer membrane protein assembly factor BamB family protein [Micromonospora tarensis]|uniref:PQQ-binding-like beta-propeller repeat protein n=1 Tax=Micromonospora tarensis TaxID=2806100 RepID=A0ABS1YML3_9ACTN|nr:PQQ-binding-like beta-propeller repeat protein [Micromonospora tarensis]MBM0278659.1 PQQ-binding-like beta-propeller repeat protein [Micromonospora tarensis]